MMVFFFGVLIGFAIGVFAMAIFAINGQNKAQQSVNELRERLREFDGALKSYLNPEDPYHFDDTHLVKRLAEINDKVRKQQ